MKTEYTVYSLTRHSETQVNHCLANVCTAHTHRHTHKHTHSLLWRATIRYSVGSPGDKEHSSVCTVCLRPSTVRDCPAQHRLPTLSPSSSTSRQPVASPVSQKPGINGRVDGLMDGSHCIEKRNNLWGQHQGRSFFFFPPSDGTCCPRLLFLSNIT